MRLLKNSLYAMLGTGLPTILAIVTVPPYVAAIGADRYGIMAIAWLFLGYFSAADFGIGRAITQRIASMRAHGSAAMAHAVWSALVSMLAFGTLGAGLVLAASHWYFTQVLETSIGLRAEIAGSLWLLALCNPVIALNGIFSGALMGLERFRLVAVANAIGTSGMLVFPLTAALFWGPQVPILLAAALVARLLGMGLAAVGVWRQFLRGHRISASRAELRRQAEFGLWVMLSGLVGPLMVLTDRFVIGMIENAAAVAAYAIPFQIASRTMLLPLAVSQALFPRFAAEEPEKARSRCRDFAAATGQLFAIPVVVLIALAGPLLQLWLGSLLDPRSVIVAQLLLAGFWINAVANIAYGYLQAIGNPRYIALLHLAELPLYFLVLFWLGSNFGLPGFAAAFALRCLADCLLLCARVGALDWRLAARLLPSATLAIAAVVVSSTFQSLTQHVLAAGTFAGLAVLALVFGLPSLLRQALRQQVTASIANLGLPGRRAR